MYGFGSGSGGSLRRLKQKLIQVDNSNYTNGQSQETINNITVTKIANLNNFIDPDTFFYKVGFPDLATLQSTIPTPDVGDMAYTRDTNTIYICKNQGAWQSFGISTEMQQYVDNNFYNKTQANYQTTKNIGYYIADVFYSFYVDNGNIYFDNGSNTLYKDNWLVCLKDGIVNGKTFNKGYLYRIGSDTLTPDENSFTEQIEINSLHIAFFSRDFEINGIPIYIRGGYIPNQDRTKIELILSQPSVKSFDFTPILSTTNAYTISESVLLLKQNYYNFIGHNALSVVNVPVYSTELEGKEIILQNSGTNTLTFNVNGATDSVSAPALGVNTTFVTLRYTNGELLVIN